MIDLGVRVVLALNSLFPLPPNLRDVDHAKTSIKEYQRWEQNELEKLIPEFGSHWDLQAKTVLDLGCGLGGKTVQYAALGAHSVTGIDLRWKSLESARSLGYRMGMADIVQFCLNDAAQMPFADNSFDVIVSINVLEHVDDLYNTLRECRRILHPDGVMLFHLPPFYSPWGAHLEGWLNFPWPHLFFPDQVLIEAAHQVEVRKHQNDSYIPSARVEWGRLRRLPELNRVTVRQFLHLIDAVGLGMAEVRMLPFGRHYLAARGSLARQMLRQIEHMASLPILRELITTKMVFVLTKESRA